MKLRQLIGLVVILGVLVAAVVARQARKPAVPTAETRADIIAVPLRDNDISEIEIRPAGTNAAPAVLLRKQNNIWIAVSQFNAPAPAQAAESLLSLLDELSGDLRSQDAALLPDYGIGDAEAAHVVVRRGSQEVAHLLVGSKRLGSDTTFVRIDGSIAVYSVDRDLLSELGFSTKLTADAFDSSRWVDRRLVSLDPGTVREITIIEPGQHENKPLLHLLSEEKEDKTLMWRTGSAYPFALDQKKVERFIQRLNTLQASGLRQREPPESQPEPFWQMTITVRDTAPLILRCPKKDETAQKYVVEVSNKDYWFELPQSTFTVLSPSDGDFFIDNPLGITGEQISELMIKERAKDTERMWRRSTGQPEATAAWVTAEGAPDEAEIAEDIVRALMAIGLKTGGAGAQTEPYVIITLARSEGRAEWTLNRAVNAGEQAALFLVTADGQQFPLTEFSSSRLSGLVTALFTEKPDAEEPVTENQ